VSSDAATLKKIVTITKGVVGHEPTNDEVVDFIDKHPSVKRMLWGKEGEN
jgi:hypothetical protein